MAMTHAAADPHVARGAAAIAWRDAVSRAARAPTPTDPERVPVAGALGRVLAEPVRAAVAMPGFDSAAMDGYAVAGPGPWRLVGRVLAGGPLWTGLLPPGAAVEIMTGAVVPAGTVTVVPYEQASHVDGWVHAADGGKAHIRRRGEDAAAGTELVAAGRVVTPAALGLLAQAGLDSVPVRRQPRVRLVVTGAEVVTAGVPGPGQVRDAIGPIVRALVIRSGGVLADHHLIGDDAGHLAAHLRGSDDVDVVVVTGSSSAGAADHLGRVLDGAGARRLVDGVACRPGHPQQLAALPGGAWVTGLPGNPFAALVACLTLLEPLLHGLTGRLRPPPLRIAVHGPLSPAPAVTRLVPVSIVGDHAVPLPGARPASLRTVALADALAVVEPDWTTGAATDLLLLP
jgi:molybdopterin molybdotransferase